MTELRTIRTLAVGLALLGAAVVPATAQAKPSGPIAYTGKTKEGSKVSFSLRKGHLDGFSTAVPTTCVSAQGGPPKATMTPWAPPYKYRLGRRYKFEVEEPYPTTTYTIGSRGREGGPIRGKLALSYSLLENRILSGYRILTCYGTASFTARPR